MHDIRVWSKHAALAFLVAYQDRRGSSMDIFCIGYGAFAVLHEIRGAGVQQIVIIPIECFNIFRG